MPDVFISYSRRDTDFVRELNNSLNNNKLETWVDWEGIEKGTKWFDEIKKGIERSSSFVFVISPDSVLSPNCDDEIKHAISCSKKILPIVYRDAVKDLHEEKQSHQEISSLNWIFFTE